MTPMSKTDEARVIRAIEDAIMLTKEGSTPNEAIEKIAQKNQLGPEMIKRVSEAFNKSKSVHMLKQAAPDDRPKSFPLADPQAIIESIYKPKMEKAASVAEPLRLPVRDFSRSDVLLPLLEKRASALRKPTMTPSSALQRYEKYNGMCSLLKQAFYDKVLDSKRQFNLSLDTAAEEIHPMSPGAFRKFAQMVVNGYPDNGQRLMTILATKTRKPDIALQKTAHAVVFPRTVSYLAISRVFEYAQKLAQDQTDYSLFVKEAEAGHAGLKAFLGHAAGSKISDQMGKGGPPPSKDGEVLDPVFYNRLKEMEAKRVLMGLILYDDDFKQYRYGDMVKAYNNAVQSVPEAFNNPVVLKNLMVKNLESSGVKDVFELKQEAELGQTLGESNARRSEEGQEPDKEEELTQSRSEAFMEMAGKVPENPFTAENRALRAAKKGKNPALANLTKALTTRALKKDKGSGKPGKDKPGKDKPEKAEKGDEPDKGTEWDNASLNEKGETMQEQWKREGRAGA